VIPCYGWYSVASNYSYGAISGIYSFQFGAEESILVLKENRSFQQELKRNGSVEHAQGSGRRLGEGGVVFSKEFRKLSGQETRPDGQADGEVKKSLGLFISIAFHPDPTGPVFHKKLFR
jgi:hypothetical protein